MTGRARSSAATETVGRAAIEAIFRIERDRPIAGLPASCAMPTLQRNCRRMALVIALSEWPRTSVPANPGAWLMTVAKRRAIDAIRRDKMRERKHEEIRHRPDGSLTTEVRLPSARRA